MERTLFALREAADILSQAHVTTIRAAGTAALRSSRNGRDFAAKVRSTTGIPLEIIDGEEEARLCAAGVLAALSPRPATILAFDIGGGSTEFVLCRDEAVLFQRSYPVGVVSLAEECSAPAEQQRRIDAALAGLSADLQQSGLSIGADCELVGTAGTVTTLAALQLGMAEYDWRRVNNLQLTLQQVDALSDRLIPLSTTDRERLPGMEPGRGDLILPGLRTVQSILAHFNRSRLTVSDFGLLEGLLLSRN